MRTLVVVSRLEDWPLELPGVEVATAREYLGDPQWLATRRVSVYNLCRSYRYQSAGYYVSLLAAARRHRHLPSLRTLLDMSSRAFVRWADEELDGAIRSSLDSIAADRFTLSVYFGRNTAKRHERLARRLFQASPAPLLRAQFQRSGPEGEARWRLVSLAPIPLREIPDEHWPFVLEAAREFFARPRYAAKAAKRPRYHLAILHDPDQELAPSNDRALRAFVAAGVRLGVGVELIRKEDIGRLPEFDALFLRETTAVNHHTFRFAQRAEREGLVVIDDPDSILRCTNKVYQAEALGLAGVPTPRTIVLDELDARAVAREVGLPCVLKSPDGAFSQGVVKCDTLEELEEQGRRALAESELVLAQEFLPSDFDWRVGVLAGKVLFACRYHMVKGHWQIVQKTARSRDRFRYGRVEAFDPAELPRRVLRAALDACATIGDGLYGVDVKELGGKPYVVEVNDNPNIDAGCEDAFLGPELYERILRVFLERIEAHKGAVRPS